MTLHEAVRNFRWDSTHDYERHETRDSRIVALYSLGLYDGDLKLLQKMVPDLQVRELRRVEHEDGDWLRVDVVEAP